MNILTLYPFTPEAVRTGEQKNKQVDRKTLQAKQETDGETDSWESRRLGEGRLKALCTKCLSGF